MRKINWKLIFGISIIVLMIGCNDDSKATSKPKELEKIIFSLGEETPTGYFNVTVNGVRFDTKVDTGNQFSNLPPVEGVQYLIIDTTFKNTSQESRMIQNGIVLAKINGKEYKFDKSEIILADGWGIFFDKINPMVSKKTKLVYKLPQEKFEEVYYIPGNNSKGFKIDLASKPIEKSEVEKQVQKETENKNKTIANSNENQKNKIGDTISTDYFDVTLHNVLFRNEVKTGNQFADKKGDSDSIFVIMDITFKNTSQESRMIQEGELIINFDGKDYKFDKSEVIMLEGWGVLLDQVNPFVSKRTKIVYKISRDEANYMVYIPGRNSGKKGFLIYDKIEIEENARAEQIKKEQEKLKKEEEQKANLQAQQSVTANTKVVNQTVSSKTTITKPKKLSYSEDDVYTYLIWKGYRGENSLERFKKDQGLPENKVIDEKVLRALGMEVKYK